MTYHPEHHHWHLDGVTSYSAPSDSRELTGTVVDLREPGRRGKGRASV